MMPILMLACVCPTTGQPDVFLAMLGHVESGNNDEVLGDRGLAVGRYQLHKQYVAECNRIAKKSNKGHVPWLPIERLRGDTSGIMVCTWMAYWVPRMEKKFGRILTDQDKLSLHRWGSTRWHPSCVNHPVDVKRWEKAQEYMKGQKP
jgi:hypothetical protein